MGMLDKRKKATIERQERDDEMVLSLIKQLGGVQIRTMEFRKRMPEPIRENHIKQSFQRLRDAGIIRIIGNSYDANGVRYELICETTIQSQQSAE
jgi:hypothetical protein